MGFPRPRMAKVAHGSLSLLPGMGLLRSPHHASGENKDGPMVQRQHPHLRHAREAPGRFLQPWTSMSNHFLIPAIPKQGDNKILKLLQKQSILWQKQLPCQSPRSSSQPPAHPGSSQPPAGLLACHHQSRKEDRAHGGGLRRPTCPGSHPERFDHPLTSQQGYTGTEGSRGNRSEEEHGALQPGLQQSQDGMGGSGEQPQLWMGRQRGTARSLPHLAGSSRETPAATCDLAPVPPGRAEAAESGAGAGRQRQPLR